MQLQKVDPPAAVIDAFRDVQRAAPTASGMRNEAEAYRNDIMPRARGEAARLIAGGRGLPDSRRRRRKGDAERFLRARRLSAQART